MFQLFCKETKQYMEILSNKHFLQIKELTDKVNELHEELKAERSQRMKNDEEIKKLMTLISSKLNNESTKQKDNFEPYEWKEESMEEVIRLRRNTIVSVPSKVDESDTFSKEMEGRMKTKSKKKLEKEEKKRKKLEKKLSESQIKKPIESGDPELKPKRKKSYWRLFRFSTKPSKHGSDHQVEEKQHEPSNDADKRISKKINIDTIQIEKANKRWNQWGEVLRSKNLISMETDIDFSNMELTLLPESFILTKMQTCTSLNISCNLFELWPPELQSHTLAQLNISMNNIREIPDSISKLTNLRALNLAGNQLGYISTALCRLKLLEYLDLSKNNLSIIPPEISSLENLKELQAFENKFESIPVEIVQLTHLELIDFSNNKIKSIPNEICHLKKLKNLLLSNNLITELPLNIGKLTNLNSLSVSSNQLQNLPSTLVSIPNLKSVLKSSDNPFTSSDGLKEASLKGDEEIVNYLLSNKGEGLISPDDINGTSFLDIIEKDLEIDSPEIKNTHINTTTTSTDDDQKNESSLDNNNLGDIPFDDKVDLQEQMKELEEEFKLDLTGILENDETKNDDGSNVKNNESPQDNKKEDEEDEEISNNVIQELENLLEESLKQKPRDYNTIEKPLSLIRLKSYNSIEFTRPSDHKREFSQRLDLHMKNELEKKINDISQWAIDIIQQELIPEFNTVKSTLNNENVDVKEILEATQVMKELICRTMNEKINDDESNLLKDENESVEDIKNKINANIMFIEEKYDQMVNILKSNAQYLTIMNIVYCIKEIRAKDDHHEK